MQANETTLELWIEALCAELGELSGAPITASTASYEGNRQDTYETALLAQGPVEGELHIAVEADALVQFTQLSSGEPLDPEVACNPERIETWRRLLDSAAGRLSAKLTGNFTDAQNSKCVVLLADTRSLQDGNPLSGEPGSRIQRWLLQAGQSKIAIQARARVEFSEEVLPVSPEPAAAADDVEPAQPLPSRENLQAEARDGDRPGSTVSAEATNDSTRADSTRADSTRADSAPTDSADPLDPLDPLEQAGTNRARSEREDVRRIGAEGGRRRPAPWGFDEPVTSPEHAHRFDLLLDIELEATLRFGAIEMPLREVLELGPGDVLSLDRHVQEPVDLVVGDRIVARGEVVLIGGNFGLHVTEVAEPRRRLETIRCLF